MPHIWYISHRLAMLTFRAVRTYCCHAIIPDPQLSPWSIVVGWYPILFEAFSYYWQATHRRKGRSKVPPPPRLFFHEIAGFGTSSRSYFLKHGDPSPPRRHLLIFF